MKPKKLTKTKISDIETTLNQEDEYDELTWGGKSTIKSLLSHIKYLEKFAQE